MQLHPIVRIVGFGMAGSDYFNQRESEILEELEQADREANDFLVEKLKAKRDRILEWADRCVKEAGKHPDIISKDEVSTYMARRMRERNISEGAIRYVREVLPKEYKNQAFVREQIPLGNGLVSINGGDNTADTAKDVIKLPKPVEKLSHAEALEAIKEVKAFADDHSSKASHARKILEAIQEKGEKERWSDVAKAYKPVRTPTPGSAEGVFYSKLIELGNGVLAYAEKVKEWPPSPEDDIRYGAAVDTYLTQLRFLKDNKFAKGTRGWLQTIKTAVIGHKHEAAVVHDTLARVPITKTDPETMEETTEWVEMKRPLTREAVGDNIEAVIQIAINKINAEFLGEVMEEHKDKYIEPYNGARRIMKHDAFSEARFGGGGNLTE